MLYDLRTEAYRKLFWKIPVEGARPREPSDLVDLVRLWQLLTANVLHACRAWRFEFSDRPIERRDVFDLMLPVIYYREPWGRRNRALYSAWRRCLRRLRGIDARSDDRFFAAELTRINSQVEKLAGYAREYGVPFAQPFDPLESVETAIVFFDHLAIDLAEKFPKRPAFNGPVVDARLRHDELISLLQHRLPWLRLQIVDGQTVRELDKRAAVAPSRSLATGYSPRWTFTPGTFAFAGISGDLTGKPFEILRLLASSTRPLSRDEIRNAVWKEDSLMVSDETVRQHVSAARAALRETFKIRFDPLPNVDYGSNLAWRIADDILREAAVKLQESPRRRVARQRKRSRNSAIRKPR